MFEPDTVADPTTDLAWLGLEPRGEGHWSFDLVSQLARLDEKFYGGTGVAVATAAMEAATGRAALWTTVQYAASADLGERLDCRVEILAHGRRTSQVRVTASVGDRLVLSASGASAEPRTGPVEMQFGDMPDVGDPADAPLWTSVAPFPIPPGNPGWLAIAELRQVEHGERRVALWARMRDMRHTRATLGFVADMVPMGVLWAAGHAGGGTSLDNTVRFGPEPDAEWVLVEIDPHMATGGYLHGAARVWAPDGTLLAVASQTATALVFE